MVHFYGSHFTCHYFYGNNGTLKDVRHCIYLKNFLFYLALNKDPEIWPHRLLTNKIRVNVQSNTRRLFSHFSDFISLVALGQDFHMSRSCILIILFKLSLFVSLPSDFFLEKREAEEPRASMCAHTAIYNLHGHPEERVFNT